MAGQSVLHDVRLAWSLLLKFWPNLPFKCIVTAMCRREKLFAVTFVGFTGYNIICRFVISPFSFSSIYHALARKYLKTPRGMDIKVRKGKLYWYSFGSYFILFFVSTSNRSTFPPGQQISSWNNTFKTKDSGWTASTGRGSKGGQKWADSMGSMIYEQN